MKPGLGEKATAPAHCKPLKSVLILTIVMAKSPVSSPAPSVALNTKSSAVPLPALPANYETALQELESLVSSLESSQLPLDQLLTVYQRGAQLLQFCRDRLEAVESQIKVLEGNELKPWTQA